jgi:hypothetical protein
MVEEQSARGTLLGRVGVDLGFYSDEQLGEALAEQWGTDFVTLYDREIPAERFVMDASGTVVLPPGRHTLRTLSDDAVRGPLCMAMKGATKLAPSPAATMASRSMSSGTSS